MNGCNSRAEKRLHDRLEVRLEVHYDINDLNRCAIAENISEGGLYLNTNDVFAPGTRLSLRIEFPERTIVHHGEVVWSIRAPEHARRTLMCGMGVQFLDFGTEWAGFFKSWKEKRR